MKKNIVFDFDDTLTTFDTIFPFLLFCNVDGFVLKQIKKGLWYFLLVLHRLKMISNYRLKDLGIKLFIYNYTLEYIKERSLKFCQNITYHDMVLEELDRFVVQQENIYISSASFQDYLTVFTAKYRDINLSSSILRYEESKVKGLEFNNYEEMKMLYFKEKNITIDVLYTDSFSDRFLAKNAKTIVLVLSKGTLVELDTYKQFEDYFKRGILSE